MKIAYIAHAIGGDVENNLADLRRIIKHINLNFPDVIPFCPYYADVVSLDDNDPEQRARGIQNGLYLLECSCVDELWLTGRKISSGMQDEIDAATELELPVVDYINKF